jgi:hypothetical protein
VKNISLIIALLAIGGAALAGPGAHGPNGEHLDGPAVTAGAAMPGIETFSEAFELVGQLNGRELSIMIDRYETNEPVLKGQLEVQYKDLKAKATFHAEHGDYSVDDEKFLKAISTPGKHALLFTFIAGDESDLLEGTLDVPADSHAHADRPMWHYGAGAGLFIAGIAIAARIRRRKGAAQ